MADNVAVTTGSRTIITSDEMQIDGTFIHNHQIEVVLGGFGAYVVEETP